MQYLTTDDILKATGGKLICGDGNLIFNNITTDSRKTCEGMLFVPIAGERFDGHEFINAAFELGAEAAVTHKDTEPVLGKTLIKVNDTFTALGDIAKYYKNKYNVPTIAVTGSVGKTTTKDMLASVISQKYNTLKTQGNFNNEIGLPLTVFGLEKHHEAAVLEMGQSHFGEIHHLADIGRPDVAVITNIGMSHIENLGSQEGIFKAKTEITDFFGSDNVLIVNGDDKFLNTIVNKPYKVVKYGIDNPECNLRAFDVCDKGIDGTDFSVVISGKEYRVHIGVAGVHNVYNALAAICAGMEFDIEPEKIIHGIESFQLTKMRMAIEKHGGVTVINDCYNASPDSVRASLKVLSSAEGARKIAVLGDILEMGDFAKDAHTALGTAVSESGADMLITVGENAKYIANGLFADNKPQTIHFEKTRIAAEYVHSIVKDGDVVLVKASRGMKFEMIVDAIVTKEEK